MNETVKEILASQKASLLDALNSSARAVVNAQTELGLVTNNYNAQLKKLNDITDALGEETVVIDAGNLQASLTPIAAQPAQPVSDQPAPSKI